MQRIWQQWKAIAEKIGNFQAGVIFSLLYFLLVVPFGFIASFFKDFLGRHQFPGWEAMDDRVSSLDKLKLQ